MAKKKKPEARREKNREQSRERKSEALPPKKKVYKTYRFDDWASI